MAKRRSRSLSLFQPSVNSTAARFEGIAEDEDDNVKQEPYEYDPPGDEHDFQYYSEEEDDEGLITNGQTAPSDSSEKDALRSDLEFVQSLKQHVNIKDGKSYKKSLRALKIQEIDAFKDMDIKEVDSKLNSLIKLTGRFRTLFSVVHDVEMHMRKLISKVKHPEKPIAPMAAHTIYLKELMANGKTPPPNYNLFKWGFELCNQLSVRNRTHYIKQHEKMMENYHRELEEFYERYPKERPRVKSAPSKQITPFNLFFEELKAEFNQIKRAEGLEQWKDLSTQRKVGYIKSAYKRQQEESDEALKVKISRKERSLMEAHNGKPDKPPKTIYALYMQEQPTRSDEYEPYSYRSLSKAEKQTLKNRLLEMVQKYEEDMLKYTKKLKGESKKIEQEQLAKFLAKYKGLKGIKESKSSAGSSKRSISEVTESVEGEIVSPKKKKSKKDESPVEEKVVVTVPQVKPEATSDKKKTPSKKSDSSRVSQGSTLETSKSKVAEAKVSKKVAKASEAIKSPPPPPPPAPPVKKEKVEPKKSKKSKKDAEVFTETKPPKTLFKYFVSINAFDSLDKAKKKFRGLAKTEKKSIRKQYQGICDSYINKLRHYLSTLKESEMKAFVKKMEQSKAEEEDTDDGLTSSDDDESGESEDESDSQ